MLSLLNRQLKLDQEILEILTTEKTELIVNFKEIHTIHKSLVGSLRYLKKIDLSSNCLKSFPNFKSTNLEVLDLSCNELKKCPNLTKFPNLIEFNASCNNIESLYNNVIELPNMKILNLKANYIKSVPKFSCCNFDELNLSSNDLTDIPEFINNSTVVKLDLANNKIDKVKYRFLNFITGELILSTNGIKSISNCDLTNITKLDLSYNNISKFHDNDGIHFKKLKELNLQNNKMNDLLICKIKNLDVLNISYNDLISFNIDKIEKIGLLNIEWNQFDDIPDLDLELKDFIF